MKNQRVVKNHFYFIVGILCILFAGTQTWNGLQIMLPVLHVSNIDSSTITVFTYQWYIIIAENIVFGIALVIMAFQKNMAKIKIAAWVIVACLLVRGVATVLITVLLGVDNVTNLLTSTIAIFALAILLLLGMRVKD